MKRFTLSIYLVLVMLLFLGCNKPDTSSKISFNYNYAAVEEYFKLVDGLKKSKKISQTKWDNFLNIEGNKLYLDENNIPKSFTDKLKTIIEKTYGTDSLYNDMFYQIRKRYQTNDSLHRQHLLWLKNNDAVLNDSIVKRTLQFLPQESIIDSAHVTIYYHALDHDGSANDKGIFISMLAAYDNNSKRLGNYESHELHHILRSSVLENKELQKQDKPLLLSLESLLNEGLADLVDKDVMLSKTSDWWMKDIVNGFYIDEAAYAMKALDSLILKESKGNHQSIEAYDDVLQYSVGHIPGYYMAKTIEENGFVTDLIKNSDNLFEFIFLYNQAISNKKEYPKFSLESISYLKGLKELYEF